MTHHKRKTGNIREERIVHPEFVNADIAERALLVANNDKKLTFSIYVGLYRIKFPNDVGLSELKINNWDLQAWYEKQNDIVHS